MGDADNGRIGGVELLEDQGFARIHVAIIEPAVARTGAVERGAEAKLIEESADKWAFLVRELGVELN